MSEKIVQIDVQAAKQKLQQASDKAITTASEKLNTAKAKVQDEVKTRRETLRDKVMQKKDSAFAKMLDKGLDLTRKQLSYLENLKKGK